MSCGGCDKNSFDFGSGRGCGADWTGGGRGVQDKLQFESQGGRGSGPPQPPSHLGLPFRHISPSPRCLLLRTPRVLFPPASPLGSLLLLRLLSDGRRLRTHGRGPRGLTSAAGCRPHGERVRARGGEGNSSLRLVGLGKGGGRCSGARWLRPQRRRSRPPGETSCFGGTHSRGPTRRGARGRGSGLGWLPGEGWRQAGKRQSGCAGARGGRPGLRLAG